MSFIISVISNEQHRPALHNSSTMIGMLHFKRQ
jgi:hypothetical protein